MSSGLRARFGAFARAFLIALPALLALAGPADAHHHHHRFAFYGYASPTDPGKDAALVVDGATGRPIYARNPDALRHPASLTKMMTLYLLFEALKDGRVTMTTPLHVSAHAAAQKPTNLHLWAGEEIPVETAIKAIVVRSANDVAVAIAEALGGTESHFAEMMTAKAKDLGMHSTYYHNASGLPDSLQITTANDLAILARHLAYDFPQYFHYFATPAFSFHGVTYPTHDNLIGRYEGADGIKTGYTGSSGFNLVSSVVRGGTHIIGVILGGRTAHLRDRAMVAMLDTAFGQIARNPTLVANAIVPWHYASVALNTPIIVNAAGVNPPQATPGPVGAAPALATQPGPMVALTAPPSTALPAANDDEDAAESKTNEGNADLSQPGAAPAAAPPPAAAPTPMFVARSEPAVATAVPKQEPQTVARNIEPRIRPRAKPPTIAPRSSAPPRTMRVANLEPRRQSPPPAPAQRASEQGEGDFDDAGANASARGWMIQIGAYATQTLAKAQLASYAEKSMDVLGQAARIVAPVQSVDGHIVYRARFGPFEEREAREVCSRLMQRGQTCFAAR